MSIKTAIPYMVRALRNAADADMHDAVEGDLRRALREIAPDALRSASTPQDRSAERAAFVAGWENRNLHGKLADAGDAQLIALARYPDAPAKEEKPK